jgi:phospholipid/cholesterol/gamma-HCH transport system substrate-binding protein
MEREANYLAVGTFILLVLGMAIAFVLWYTDANDGREYSTYEIRFAGSVSGLDRGSPVRFLGVDVGRVRRLGIDPQNPSRVEVVVDVDESAPISSATRASLKYQGVTGLLYIELREAPDVVKTASLHQGRRYPQIESVASDFDVLIESLPELMGRATALLERASRVLSDENLAALNGTLKNLQETTASLPATAKDVAALIKQMQATVVEVRGAAEGLHTITTTSQPEIQNALAKMSAIAENLEQASARIDRFTQKSEVQLGNFSEQGLFELQRLMRETRSAAREFRDLSRSLKENPSQILYEPPASGVEIAP